MTKRSEERKLEAKKQEWDRIMRGFKEWWKRISHRAWREIKYNMTDWLEWYFGDKDRKGLNRTLHRIAVISVDIILLRLLHFI